MFHLCQIASYKCEPCNQTFPTPQSTDSTSLGILTNYSLKALQFTHLPVQRMQIKRLNFPILKHLKICTGRQRNSDIDNEAEDTTDLEDLIEEMNDKVGQTNESYFPFPSKIFALLYLLLNSPHPIAYC